MHRQEYINAPFCFARGSAILLCSLSSEKQQARVFCSAGFQPVVFQRSWAGNQQPARTGY
jgi:hypothetical protein